MKRLPFVLAFVVLLSFLANAQASSQISRKVNSSGTIVYSTQSLAIKRYTFNCYGIFDTTPQIYAELYDISIADTSDNVVAGLAAVKALRPDFKALLYWNMRSVLKVDWMSTVWDACVANGWFLLDNGGNRILTDVGYLVDFGSAAYQAWIANYLNTKIVNVGYDGLYGDNNLAYSLSDYTWLCSAMPINPRTGSQYTDADVVSDMIAYQTTVKNALGSKLYVANGIWGGYRFLDHQSTYTTFLAASPIDGFMSEGIWHPYVDSSPPQWMSETLWQESVQFLMWVQDNWLSGHSDRLFMPVVKLARGNQNPTSLPSGATKEQMALYGYASMLLGVEANEASKIFFGTNLNSAFCGSYMQPLYNAQIGTPTNNFYVISGTHVYARDFSDGKVLVNPTDQQYSVSLTKTYVTLEGQIVSSLNIEPHTGAIMKSGA